MGWGSCDEIQAEGPQAMRVVVPTLNKSLKKLVINIDFSYEKIKL